MRRAYSLDLSRSWGYTISMTALRFLWAHHTYLAPRFLFAAILGNFSWY
jgi:hypothetical protein